MTDPTHGVKVGREGTVETVGVSEADAGRLKPGAIGLLGVIFVAVTGAAPISAMLFNVPFATGFGTGYYPPAAFLFAAVVLTIFSVGYVAMAKEISAAGGMYSFISHGLGQALGLATGICGVVAYALFEISLLGGFAYFFSTNFNSWFEVEIPWVLPAVGASLLICVLCWFDVELSVKVLGVALVSEIIILVLFDILVFGQGGSTSGIAFSSVDVTKLLNPGVGLAAGVGLFLAFWSWVGFEAIPNYAEESKDPKRNVVRATLIAVIGLGIGYVITAVAFESAFPKDKVVEAAQDPAGPFFVAMESFGTHWLATIMQVLILTGSFACAMAFHNVTMRYFYAMGREGILPSALGRTHGKHKVPHIANVTAMVSALVIMLIWGIFSGFGFDKAFDTAYVRIYTMMAVQGVVWILAIQALCALAIIVYFRTDGRKGNPITTIICPIIAIVGQIFAIILLFLNIDTLAGTISYAQAIAPIAVVLVIVALVYAFVLRSTNRAKFDTIGRVIDESGEL